MRTAVVDALSSAFGGDDLAAEMTLLSTISRVVGRCGELPVGKMSINLMGCPSSADGGQISPVAASLREVLGQLLPLCPMLKITIDELNASTIIPRKDHDANVIWPAALQLPAGCALVLDEANMSAGNLRDNGVKNGKFQIVCLLLPIPFADALCSL